MGRRALSRAPLCFSGEEEQELNQLDDFIEDLASMRWLYYYSVPKVKQSAHLLSHLCYT